MDMTKEKSQNKHYIEFCNHVFALEDVKLIIRYYDWTLQNEKNSEKKWHSRIVLCENIQFSFNESEYEKIKNLILDINCK